jgi:hypothetical protein
VGTRVVTDQDIMVNARSRVVPLLPYFPFLFPFPMTGAPGHLGSLTVFQLIRTRCKRDEASAVLKSRAL